MALIKYYMILILPEINNSNKIFTIKREFTPNDLITIIPEEKKGKAIKTPAFLRGLWMKKMKYVYPL